MTGGLQKGEKMFVNGGYFDGVEERIVMSIHKYNRSGGDMRMQGIGQHPPPKLFPCVKSHRDQSFPKVLAVHPNEGVKGLLLRLKLHEDAKLPLEEV